MNSLILTDTNVVKPQFKFSADKSHFIPASTTLFYTCSLENNGSLLCIHQHGEQCRDLEIPLESSNENQITNFYSDSEYNRLIIALKSGEIFGINCDNWMEDPIGVIDAGIHSIKPSPDGELLVIITGILPDVSVPRLILMTRDFDIVSEFPLFEQENDAFVNVGWGKKETQFHGTEGKAAASKVSKIEELGPDDDLIPRISWRGDGDYFVVSFIPESGNKRLLHIYNREAVLQNSSENVPCLEHSLSWRPSGNLIASTQKTHKHDVVFFERNGLRHGEFTLPDMDAVVHDLSWNADSSLLAVHSTNSNNSYNTIQFYGSKNYHWYLRYEIRGKFLKWSWDSEVPLLFHVFHSGTQNRFSKIIDGTYQHYKFNMEVLKSSSLHESNLGTVAVIDGNQILLTPFKKHNVPPPMSHSILKLASPASHLSFDKTESGQMIAALLSNSTLEIWNNVDSKQNDVKLISTISTPHGSQPKQIAWIQTSTLLLLNYNNDNLQDELLVLLLNEELSTILSKKNVQLPSGLHRISKLVYDVNTNTPAFQTSQGNVYEIMDFEGDWYCNLKTKFPSYCSWISAISIGPERNMRAWIGLNERNKLYINDKLIAGDCTSFSVHNDFLIISTLDHVAKFAPLSQNFDSFQFLEKDETAIGFFDKSRRIEQGAKLVIAVPGHVNLVLEMPRGNLETVYPRALVLSSIRKCIEQKDYRSAFLSCRKHRIDLNLLVDHDYEQFIDQASEFVKQIPELDYLNLFISSLKNEDVTKTMYPIQSSQKSIVPEDKLNAICSIMQSALEKMDNQSYNLSIITTDAKKNPPALEDAMNRIAKIKLAQSAEAAEEALKYLIFLVDVESLYKIALGMYDFHLVLMVAQHSHMDPREYLPFLSELKKMNENYQKYKIDDFLKKYEKAIGHLSKCDDKQDELIAYMNKHKLYQKCLELYSSSSPLHNLILKNFADHQFSVREFGQAGISYQMAKEYTQALESYVEAHMWKEAFTICRIANLDRAEITERLIESMIENRRFQEVSTIYLQYLKDPVAAIDILIKGFLWSEAILVCTENGMTEKINNLIIPAMKIAATNFTSDINEAINLFEKQTLRLRQVRVDKRKPVIPAENDEKLDNIDMLSDTASMATTRVTSSTKSTAFTGMTGMSVKTARTSRQKRKLAKKRATGKDAAYEDEFLMKSLKRAVEKFNSQTVEITPLLMSLMTNSLTGEAKLLQETYGKFQALIKTYLDEIFDTPVLPVPSVEIPVGVDEPVGITPDIIIKPQVSGNEWWINAFSH